MQDKFIDTDGITFDDVLILPARSSVVPAQVDTRTRFTRNIELNIPLVSAAMDTVTEAMLAIAMALEGGIGCIHKNMGVGEQAAEVERVKKSESGTTGGQIVLSPGAAVGKRLYPNACRDSEGRLRVGAAVGVSGDLEERVQELVRAGVDVLVLDSAHGHSENVIRAAESIRNLATGVELVLGNVGTAEGAEELMSIGADAIKVGMGPGATCTTRVIAGVGVPQITAILDCARVADKKGVPVIADGGIRHSGDIAKAIAAGASTVMVGNLFAGTEETPGETVLYEGRSYKLYRGMGAPCAMRKGSADRYGQEAATEEAKLVAEGIEGRVPYKGPIGHMIFQLVGGLRAGMGYCGARTIAELRTKARFIRISRAGLRESHPHDITITREAPNYGQR